MTAKCLHVVPHILEIFLEELLQNKHYFKGVILTPLILEEATNNKIMRPPDLVVVRFSVNLDS